VILKSQDVEFAQPAKEVKRQPAHTAAANYT